MKPAAEWIQSKTHCVKKNVITERFTEADIRAIQADALEHAALTAEASLRDVWRAECSEAGTIRFINIKIRHDAKELKFP